MSDARDNNAGDEGEPTQTGRPATMTGALLVLLLVTAWMAYQQHGGPSSAAAFSPIQVTAYGSALVSAMAVPITPLADWETVDLDRQTRQTLRHLTDLPDPPKDDSGAFTADLFDPALAEQITPGTPAPETLAAVRTLRLQSILSVAGDLRCTVDGRVYRVGDTVALEGEPFVLDAVEPDHVILRTDEHRYRVPFRP